MVTPVDEERPRSSGLSSNTVLDALNKNDDSDYQDTDSDSDVMDDVVECADEEELRTTLGTSNESSQSSSTTSAGSLLNILRAPKQSDLTRKRKLQCNPGKHKKIRSSSSTSFEPKSVKPQDRLRKYPNEYLNVSHGKLFCIACREELSLKSSSLTNHLKSQKHKEGKERLKRKKVRERDIATKLTSYNI